MTMAMSAKKKGKLHHPTHTQNKLPEYEHILQCEDYGNNEEQRRARLASATLTAKGITVCSIILCLWSFLFPNIFTAYVLGGMLLIVPCSIITIIYYKGLLDFSLNTSSKVRPTLGFAFVIVAFSLMFKGVMGYDLIDNNSVVFPAVVITLFIASCIWYFGKPSYIQPLFSYYYSTLLVPAIMFFYGMGGCIILNCSFDQSTVSQYQSTVLSKRILGSGKGKSYLVALSSWGHHKRDKEIDVRYELYNKLDSGSTLRVHYHQGLLGLPWYELFPENR